MRKLFAYLLDLWRLPARIATFVEPIAMLQRMALSNHERIKAMAHTLSEVLEVVKAEKAGSESLITLVKGLQKQLADVLAGELSPTAQAKVDAIFDAATANVDEIQAALDANPPAPPAPPPATPIDNVT